MASCSSQTDPSPSNSQPNYDVFLSFRGPDTRNTFTSHLHAALVRSGIRTFIDDEELRVGKEIKPELRKAIQNSKMSIVIFSKNYASSRWCLDELVEILECRRSRGQTVLPVFYDVEPFVVRYQTRSYEEAFKKYSSSELLDIQKVKEWRDALKEAADLSGHVVINEENGNEARLIQKIVQNVHPEVDMRYLSLPENLIGVDSHVDCINKLLNIESDNDVRLIGIYGMGGVGKTTVSKAVYNKHLHQFEVCAFVENIKQVSKARDGMLSLQENLLRQLRSDHLKLSNSDEGINSIRKVCCSKRVLILLDDLNNFDQIKILAGHKRWFGAGSRVIMVTRDAKLLLDAQVDDTYKVNELDESESLELFRWHAIGEGDFPSEDHKFLSMETTTYCGGLPLALEVIGRHMRCLTVMSWKNSLEELRNCPEKSIQDRLKISYDALHEHGKNIFLDVACLFIGENKDYLVKFWHGCKFSPENSIRELVDKCLLKFDENNCLRMHDLLRDMGRTIVVQESHRMHKMPSRIWIDEEVRDLLECPKGAETVEGFRLDLSYIESMELDTSAFEEMYQLRFLVINNVDVIGSFKHLFRRLRWLTWRFCPLKSLPIDFYPRELVVLDLKYSKINKLWEGVKQLNNLKILDLSACTFMVETPNFTGLRSLERLILNGCSRLSKLHPSIALLDRLSVLHMQYCVRLTDFPKSFCELRSLQVFLVGFSRLGQLPEQLGNLESLHTLDVSKTLLEVLPDSIGQLSKLVHLRLRDCKKLVTLPTSFRNLMSLQELDVAGCNSLRLSPELLGGLKCLLELDLRWCHSFKHLPISISSNFRSLKKLCIDGNSNVHALLAQVGELKCLLDLRISNVDGLTTLPDNICDLRSLTRLSVLSCSKLKRLPKELGNLERLVNLVLGTCKNLRKLPASICNMKSLQSLDVSGCLKLEELPEGIGNMKSLRSLDASLTGLQDLPDSLRHLASLTHLYLSYCGRLKKLPNSVCNLSSLEELNILGCSSMTEPLPDELGNLVRLRKLNAIGIDSQYLPADSMKNLKELESLLLGSWDTDSQLISAFQTFALPHKSSLKRLELWYCNLSDQDIPPDIGTCFLSLEFLGLVGGNFRYLPASLGQLVNLTHLHLSYCEGLVSLPELPFNLQQLKARSCKEMEFIPNLSNLKFLHSIDLSNSRSLDELQGLGNLKMLNYVNLAGCNNLTMDNTSFSESFFQRCFRDAYESFNITLPVWDFQDWIIHQSMGSTISFDIPQTLPDNKFQGIILWVVYAHFSSDVYTGVIRNHTSGQRWYHIQLNNEKTLGGHSWVSFITSSGLRSGDNISISIPEHADALVLKCGVHWLLDYQGDEDEDASYFSTRHKTYDYCSLAIGSDEEKAMLMTDDGSGGSGSDSDE